MGGEEGDKLIFENGHKINRKKIRLILCVSKRVVKSVTSSHILFEITTNTPDNVNILIDERIQSLSSEKNQ